MYWLAMTATIVNLWIGPLYRPAPTVALCRLPADDAGLYGRNLNMNFDEAFDLTLSWEGGDRLHRVPGDPGGTTKYGISQRAYPDLDIPSLTLRKASFYARRDYWNAVRAEDLPPEIRWDVFDTAFNAGAHRAGKLLQRSINLCRQAQGVTDFIHEDGQIGPVTVQAAEGFDAERLLRVYRAYRREHYLALAETGRAQFIHGWLRRAEGERNG